MHFHGLIILPQLLVKQRNRLATLDAEHDGCINELELQKECKMRVYADILSIKKKQFMQIFPRKWSI